MDDLGGKAVLVTGSASGIGRATAIAFAQEGAGPLILNDINAEGLAGTASEITRLGCEALTFDTDVSDFEAVGSMIEQALEKVGRIDVLANVAGWGMMAPLEDLDIADWRGIINVNLFGTIHTVHFIYPHMLERKSGHIVNVASSDGLFAPGLYGIPYFTSKFGVVGFSEGLMLEASVYNIGVTCICPGAVKTPAFETSPIKGFRPEVRKLARLLEHFAEAPEDTARRIVRAVRKNEFLVVTTPWARFAYYQRRHSPSRWFRHKRREASISAIRLNKYRMKEI